MLIYEDSVPTLLPIRSLIGSKNSKKKMGMSRGLTKSLTPPSNKKKDIRLKLRQKVKTQNAYVSNQISCVFEYAREETMVLLTNLPVRGLSP